MVSPSLKFLEKLRQVSAKPLISSWMLFPGEFSPHNGCFHGYCLRLSTDEENERYWRVSAFVFCPFPRRPLRSKGGSRRSRCLDTNTARFTYNLLCFIFASWEMTAASRALGLAIYPIPNLCL